MGCAHDVYEARLPEYLDGCLSFSTLALILYQEYGIVPLATAGHNHLDMRLFPSRMTVKRLHTVFLLATYPDAVNQVETLGLPARIPNYPKIVDKWQAKSMTEKLRTTIRNSVTSIGLATNPSMLSMDSSRAIPELLKAMEDIAKRRLTGTITRVLPCETEDDVADPSHHDDKDINHLTVHDSLRPPSVMQVETDLSPAKSMLPPILQPVSPADTANMMATDVVSVATAAEAPPPLVRGSTRLPFVNNAGASPQNDSPPTSSSPLSNQPQSFEKLLNLSRSPSVAFADFLGVVVPANLSGHIILCGMPNALHDFVAPLRHQLDSHAKSTQFLGSSQHAMTATPIIIISEIPLTEKQHASIAMFQKVYFLCGSPLQEDMLRQASAFTAKSIVILGSCLQSPGRYDDDDEEEDGVAADTKDQNMLDTDAITLHRYVVECCECNCPPGSPMATVIVELSRPSSLRFLKDDLVRSENPSTLEAVKTLTKRVLSRADDPLDNICHPIYAAGTCKVFISNSLDAVLGSCNKYGCIIDLLHLLTFGEGATNEFGRVLDQIAVPILYHNKSYLECFVQMLVTQDILCLGLYRHRPKRHSYVYVNPNEDVRVQSSDRLFVLR
ncbi:hypothetical protein DYB36_009801 [Aphanomyces astaci]|uniref:RCK N-terminal domain-containing protein n=1 Tax=Aphanomyces astaci TaxID=112090 RepID=A0A397BF45_APHAT|nr:hypothetical protein DYB36_009801 [Aphanomyces astaci]